MQHSRNCKRRYEEQRKLYTDGMIFGYFITANLRCKELIFILHDENPQYYWRECQRNTAEDIEMYRRD